jgi:hypothetical protein
VSRSILYANQNGEALNNEKYVKRECGCEIELVDMKGGPSKLYLNVCANHRADLEFRTMINGLVTRFDTGLKRPAADPRD